MNKLLMIVIVLAMSIGAAADSMRDSSKLVSEKYSISVNPGEILRNESIIQIRKSLIEQGVDLSRKAIKSVIIDAKSRAGRARVSLQIGRYHSEEKIIPGNQGDFFRRGAMHRLVLQAPLTVREQLERGGVVGLGHIRLNLRGNIRVKRVLVQVVRRERLVIQTYSIFVNPGEILRNESIIQIRKSLIEQGVDLSRKAIKSVIIDAKSRAGRARVSLQIGRYHSEEKIIPGNQGDFFRRGAMHRLVLQAPLTVREQLERGGVVGLGHIRLNLRGNIRVKRVLVQVVRRGRR